MNIKEAVKVVNFLHTAYTSDNKATASDLAQRSQTYSVTFAEYDLETVMKAAQHCVRTSRCPSHFRERTGRSAARQGDTYRREGPG